jgi:hypothetical protein
MIRIEKLKVQVVISYPNLPVDIFQLYFLMTTYVIFCRSHTHIVAI